MDFHFLSITTLRYVLSTVHWKFMLFLRFTSHRLQLLSSFDYYIHGRWQIGGVLRQIHLSELTFPKSPLVGDSVYYENIKTPGLQKEEALFLFLFFSKAAFLCYYFMHKHFIEEHTDHFAQLSSSIIQAILQFHPSRTFSANCHRFLWQSSKEVKEFYKKFPIKLTIFAWSKKIKKINKKYGLVLFRLWCMFSWF